MIDDVRALIAALTASDPERVHSVVDGWSPARWQEALLDLPIDSATFTAQFEVGWNDVIAALERRLTLLEEPPAQPGDADDETGHGADSTTMDVDFLGVLHLTLSALAHSERYRDPWASRADDGASDGDSGGASDGASEGVGGDTDPRRHDDARCARTCHRLVSSPAVRRALRSLYAPTASADPTIAESEWDDLDVDTLAFHAHGTTSFILRGESAPRRGEARTFALKCIIYPFLRIPTIKRATRDYAVTYNMAGLDVEHLVRVWASDHSWILMDFVPGRNLADFVADRRRLAVEAGSSGKSDVDLALLDDLGVELFHALEDLEQLGRPHLDLSPTNIVVVPGRGSDVGLRIIDLGVNYLYLNSIAGRDGGDASYVAPEVRSGTADPEDRTQARSDLYSLGRLLVFMAVGTTDPAVAVPEAIYRDAPLLARFFEDLCDLDAAQRGSVFRVSTGGEPAYRERLAYFKQELTVTERIKTERAYGSSTFWADLAELRSPLSGAFARQMRIRRIRREQKLYGDPARNMRAPQLLFWSTLCSVMAAFTTLMIVLWTLRHAGWDWTNPFITFLQRVTGAESGEFPIVDALMADDWEIPAGADPLGLGILGLSFVLVGLKYYQSMFAEMAPSLRRGGGKARLHAYAAEVAMRAWTVIPLLLTLPPLLRQPRWWPLFVAFGLVMVTLSNWAVASYARRVLPPADRGDGRRTPAPGSPGVSLYLSWIPGNILYALLVAIVAVLLTFELARDQMVYIVGLTLINILQLYGVKCSHQGPGIRAGLIRAGTIAERRSLVPDRP